jgi:hypothetical protein
MEKKSIFFVPELMLMILMSCVDAHHLVETLNSRARYEMCNFMIIHIFVRISCALYMYIFTFLNCDTIIKIIKYVLKYDNSYLRYKWDICRHY